MIAVKWRIFKALSYIQLAYSFLFFSWFIWSMISLPRPPAEPIIPVVVGLVSVMMVTSPIINILILMKNFPDKPLAASTSSLYNLSIFMNILTVAGLALGLIAGFMSEVSHENTSADRTGLIILTLLALITIVNLILLICQLGIRKYLRKNSQATLKFMVDSIGSTRSEISFDP